MQRFTSEPAIIEAPIHPYRIVYDVDTVINHDRKKQSALCAARNKKARPKNLGRQNKPNFHPVCIAFLALASPLTRRPHLLTSRLPLRDLTEALPDEA